MEEKNNNKEKIQALREMILNAEKTLQGAKSMLLQLEGKKKTGRKRKMTEEDVENGKVVEGIFDGQIMIGTDGRQYPIPANYASKSKLVESDMLKLTITVDGSFIYKQIGPVERKRIIGIVSQDADENFFVAAEGKAYKVLFASITYFKVEPGDEVTLVTPRDIESDWGSIENVLQKNKFPSKISAPSFSSEDLLSEIAKESSPQMKEKGPKKNEKQESPANVSFSDDLSLIDEWTPDIEEIKKELNNKNKNKSDE